MVFIIRGNWDHVKHSRRSDASDWAAGDIIHVPLTAAPTAVNRYHDIQWYSATTVTHQMSVWWYMRALK
eukprot:6173928-Pleurochrysis_carterae.AAC.1